MISLGKYIWHIHVQLMALTSCIVTRIGNRLIYITQYIYHIIYIKNVFYECRMIDSYEHILLLKKANELQCDMYFL